MWCLRLHGLVSRFDADVQTLYIFIVRLPWLLLQLTIGTHLNPFSLMSSIFQPVLWNVFFLINYIRMMVQCELGPLLLSWTCRLFMSGG